MNFKTEQELASLAPASNQHFHSRSGERTRRAGRVPSLAEHFSRHKAAHERDRQKPAPPCDDGPSYEQLNVP
jgi:hypothetical protein